MFAKRDCSRMMHCKEKYSRTDQRQEQEQGCAVMPSGYLSPLSMLKSSRSVSCHPKCSVVVHTQALAIKRGLHHNAIVCFRNNHNSLRLPVS